MNPRSSKIAFLAVAVLIATAAIARADCESDLIQLQDAYKAPNLTADGKAAVAPYRGDEWGEIGEAVA